MHGIGMAREVRGLHGGVAAAHLAAREGPLARVREHVALEVARGGRRVVAPLLLAHKGTFTRVGHHVLV